MMIFRFWVLVLMGSPIIDQSPTYGPGQSELDYAGTVPSEFVTRHPFVELLV